MINKNNKNITNPIKRKTFLLVFNSDEGRLKAHKRVNHIIKRLSSKNCCFEITDSKSLENRADLQKFDCVVAVGGDGTILSVLPVVSKYNIKLGIIPCGTANLFASGLLIPRNIDKAIDILFTGRSSNVDIGKAGEKYFALRVGVGADADVVNNASTFLKDKLGYLAYYIEGIKNAFSLKLKKMKITIDGEVFEVKANSVIVANVGNMFRNFFTIAPNCSTNDGKLDIFILRTRNLMEFLKVYLQILLGRHTNTPNVFYGQGSNIKIETMNINTHIDGEPLNKSILDISVIPKALQVLVPSSAQIPAYEKVLVR